MKGSMKHKNTELTDTDVRHLQLVRAFCTDMLTSTAPHSAYNATIMLDRMAKSWRLAINEHERAKN